jgi:hypothetical protein
MRKITTVDVTTTKSGIDFTADVYLAPKERKYYWNWSRLQNGNYNIRINERLVRVSQKLGKVYGFSLIELIILAAKASIYQKLGQDRYNGFLEVLAQNDLPTPDEIQELVEMGWSEYAYPPLDLSVVGGMKTFAPSEA